MFQILLDHLVRHLPYSGTEVPSGPEVPTQFEYRMAAISVVHAEPPLAQHIFAAKADRLKPVVLTL